MGPLRFEYVEVYTEPFTADGAQHSSKAKGCVFSLESHIAQRFAERIAMEMRRFLARRRRKNIAAVIRQRLGFVQDGKRLAGKRDDVIVGHFHTLPGYVPFGGIEVDLGPRDGSHHARS